jgi:hydrogenase maturation protein HypF
VSICDDCLRDLFDPSDRRYLYPFINCTNCGPRFTIIEDIPYDRPKTTMAGFPMCPDCLQEYEDPADRRFHAQPVACPVCGPSVWLEVSPLTDAAGLDNLSKSGDSVMAIRQAQRLLKQGLIIAVKGLGGFHLACDARNPQAVARLRARKLRVDKPFAVMMADLDTVASHCELSEAEKVLLVSRQRPIVILHKKPASPLPADLAPGQQSNAALYPAVLHVIRYFPFMDRNLDC